MLNWIRCSVVIKKRNTVVLWGSKRSRDVWAKARCCLIKTPISLKTMLTCCPTPPSSKLLPGFPTAKLQSIPAWFPTLETVLFRLNDQTQSYHSSYSREKCWPYLLRRSRLLSLSDLTLPLSPATSLTALAQSPPLTLPPLTATCVLFPRVLFLAFLSLFALLQISHPFWALSYHWALTFEPLYSVQMSLLTCSPVFHAHLDLL